MHPWTVAVHAGRGEGASLNAPLVPASSLRGGAYAREDGSPGWAPFEDAIGALEGGTAVAFASGMGAAAAIVQALPRGARVVGPERGYAWTRSLLARGDVEHVMVDTSDTEATLRASEGADLLWLESPSNPLLEVADLERLCAAGIPVAVDGTFATPLLQRPLELGATLSMHSASKFIGGHTDLLLGVVTTREPEWVERLQHARAQLGATPGALEAFLALRGLRTLPVRLDASQRTARMLAERLAATRTVHYPGFGAMLSFEHADPDAVCSRVRLFTYTKSLGGVESLIDKRGPQLVRVSVGCEYAEDLWADLEQAL